MAWILSTNQITRLQFEITNYCNAGCPQCARANYLSKGFLEQKSVYPKSINSHHFDIEKYKQILENDSWDSLNNIHFCGNYDEPTIHPQFLEMIEYTYEWLKKNSLKNIEIGVSTNGGTRNREFWKKMGELSQKYSQIGNALLVIWGIDGLEDTNHLYRIGVHWEKLMENVDEYHKYHGYSCWQWIRFEHNAHQFEWAKQNYKKMGFDSFKVVGTNRPTVDIAVTSQHNKRQQRHTQSQVINTPVPVSSELTAQCNDIQCKALDPMSSLRRSLYVDAFGHVFPCCWMGTDYSKKQAEQSFLGDLTPQSHNIYHYNSMTECLHSTYFDQLIATWPDQSYAVCAKYCKSKGDPYTVDRQLYE